MAQTDLEIEKAEALDAELESLRDLNTFCFRLHLAQGGLLFVLSFVNDSIAANKFSVTSLFSDWSGDYPVQDLDTVGKIGFLRACSYFALLSAVAHWYVL
jgi:hypothetical protein